YTPSQWASEIKSAAAQGIDAFALNIGYDSWQAGQVQSAYDAAAANGFKMVLSFDMTVLGCGDSNVIQSNVDKYSNHPAQLKDNGGKAIVTTFDGGNCKSSDEWKSELDGARFVPAFFNDLNYVSLKSLYPVVGGDLLWGGAWPKFDEPISWSEDSFRISHNGLNRGAGDLYITTVSPWFFTHYGGKNFIWHNDDHLWNNRWEDLVEHRNQVDAVEIVSWNDYGESTYIGPIGKDQPGSEAWVNGFDHRAFLEMTGYYASAFKSGSWPSITSDKIFIYGRPHGVNDQASSDPLPRPDRYNWVTDKLWIVLFSTGSGSLTVTQGSSSSTTQVKAGVNKISMPLGVASSVTAVLTRGGEQVFDFTAPISFGHSPKTYNFNMNAAMGP
ncbi:glycoside hydrolase family 71 protein, partial [Tulasnella calospora MUT 4182]